MNADKLKEIWNLCALENQKIIRTGKASMLNLVEICYQSLSLCDEIERLQKENAKLKKALAECAGY